MESWSTWSSAVSEASFSLLSRNAQSWIYIYIYIEREREGERERGGERDKRERKRRMSKIVVV